MGVAFILNHSQITQYCGHDIFITSVLTLVFVSLFFVSHVVYCITFETDSTFWKNYM